MRIFATSVSTSASAAASTTRTTGSRASCSHGSVAWGTKIWAASTSTIQWRAAALHWRSARSRPPYSSSRPSWIIVSSRCVSGLSIGWRPVSAMTTSAKPTAPSARPGDVQAVLPEVPATMPVRSVVPAMSAATPSESTRVASVNTLIVRSRLAPIREKPFAVSQDAAPSAKRARARRPPSASMLCPTPRSGASPATGTRSTAATSAAAATGGAAR